MSEIDNNNESKLEEFNRLKHVFSVLITIFNNSYFDCNNLKIELKNYLENQNNELKSDRIITIDNTIKNIDEKESEILRSYIPTFMYHVEINRSYSESLIELDNAPKLFYEILNIFYMKEYGKIYNIIDTSLKSNLESYWCVIL